MPQFGNIASALAEELNDVAEIETLEDSTLHNLIASNFIYATFEVLLFFFFIFYFLSLL